MKICSLFLFMVKSLKDTCQEHMPTEVPVTSKLLDQDFVMT